MDEDTFIKLINIYDIDYDKIPGSNFSLKNLNLHSSLQPAPAKATLFQTAPAKATREEIQLPSQTLQPVPEKATQLKAKRQSTITTSSSQYHTKNLAVDNSAIHSDFNTHFGNDYKDIKLITTDKLNEEIPLKDVLTENRLDLKKTVPSRTDILSILRTYKYITVTNKDEKFIHSNDGKSELNRIEIMMKLRYVLHGIQIPEIYRARILGNVVSQKTVIPGKGFKRTRIIGKGIDNRKYFDKVYIDVKRLENNVLFCKYINSNTNINGLKQQTISNDCKDVIKDIINDRFNNKIYNLLNNNDRRIIKSFVKVFKYDLGIQDKNDDDMQEQFNVLLGEYEAGNNNPDIKNKLKQYIRIAIRDNLINYKDGLALLIELN